MRKVTIELDAERLEDINTVLGAAHGLMEFVTRGSKAGTIELDAQIKALRYLYNQTVQGTTLSMLCENCGKSMRAVQDDVPLKATEGPRRGAYLCVLCFDKTDGDGYAED